MQITDEKCNQLSILQNPIAQIQAGIPLTQKFVIKPSELFFFKIKEQMKNVKTFKNGDSAHATVMYFL